MKSMTKRLRFALSIVMVLLGLVGFAAAQEDASAPAEVTADQVNEIASGLYCPVCENIPLDACGTAACADWRNEIRLFLEQGMTEDEIVEDFVLRFGDRVVGTPLDPILRGLSLVTPWLVIVGILAGGWYFLRRGNHGDGLIEPEPLPTSPYYDTLENDLKG